MPEIEVRIQMHLHDSHCGHDVPEGKEEDASMIRDCFVYSAPGSDGWTEIRRRCHLIEKLEVVHEPNHNPNR
jgi:hypothetical protein